MSISFFLLAGPKESALYVCMLVLLCKLYIHLQAKMNVNDSGNGGNKDFSQV